MKTRYYRVEEQQWYVRYSIISFPKFSGDARYTKSIYAPLSRSIV